VIRINEETDKQDKFYDDFYSELMGTGGIARVWSFIHQRMERPFRKSVEERVLEIGAGNGEHFSAITSAIQTYYATDIRVDILNKSLGSNPNVIVEMQDVNNITHSADYFDRVIMTCVLVHLDDQVAALREIRRVIKPGGYFSLYIPCEPGILLRFLRLMTTHAKARRLGIENIQHLHFLEHRNYFLSSNYFVKSVFSGDEIRGRYYPFPFFTWNFNLFRLYTIKVNSK
jgi:ubiquinone/menaquinone biosynthesis C-methylase UbiE